METIIEVMQNLYLIFSLKNNYFGVDALNVKEIIKLPDITKVPNPIFGVRGMIKFRDHIIPIVDMRLKMGMDSLREENFGLVETLKHREEEHNEYLNELENCLINNTKFTKTFDPKECPFGKWYYNFNSENIVVTNLLEEFEQPHNMIHEFAKKMISMNTTSSHEDVIKQYNRESKLRLNALVKLFHELYEKINLETRELAIIYELGDKLLGFSVDKVYRIVTVDENEIKELEGNLRNEAFDGLIEVNERMCVLLNNKIFDSALEGVF